MDTETVVWVVVALVMLVIAAAYAINWASVIIAVLIVVAQPVRDYAARSRGVVRGALEIVFISCAILLVFVGLILASAAILLLPGATDSATVWAKLLLASFAILAVIASYLTHRWFRRHPA